MVIERGVTQAGWTSLAELTHIGIDKHGVLWYTMFIGSEGCHHFACTSDVCKTKTQASGEPESEN
jgi:hypothetical protein